MPRLIALVALLGFAGFAKAEDKKVAITFLGGAKKVPLEGLKVSIRTYTGDWSEDKRRKPIADGKTGKDGAAAFTLASGRYYVDIESEKELPYLQLSVGHKESPSLYDRHIKVGDKTSFEFNLADACKLTLRAVDADTGEGIPGVEFVTENALGEYWAETIRGDNLGARQIGEGKPGENLKTDKDGNFTRLLGPRPGYTYYVWSVPKGYEIPDAYGEVELRTPLGTTNVEHAFKIRKKK